MRITHFLNSIIVFVNRKTVLRIFSISIGFAVSVSLCALLLYKIPFVNNYEGHLEEILKILSCIGLLKSKGFIVLSCRSPFTGYFTTYVLTSMLAAVLYIGLVILDNVFLLSLNILAIIFVKAFLLDFYNKHFIWNSFGGKQSFRKYINIILSNITKIVKTIIKYWFAGLIIGIIIRSYVAYCLDDSFISSALILTLPFPLFFYFLNIIIKKLNKEEITSEDLYLYNKFVVDRVNLYRISYTLGINYIYKTYFIHVITVTAVLIFIAITILMILLVYKWSNKLRRAELHQAAMEQSRQKEEKSSSPRSAEIRLHSKGDSVAVLVSAFIGLSNSLQASCNEGFAEFYSGVKKVAWPKLPFSSPGMYQVGNTVNVVQPKHPLLEAQPELKDTLVAKRKSLEDSPILNMCYRQKNTEGTRFSEWGYRPVTFFTHDEYYGSVSQVRKGKFLIVNFIRKDSDGCVFMPTFYLPDNTESSENKIRNTIDILEMKYNILLPKEKYAGLVIYTQAESINNGSLFRLWRPSIYYTEPSVIQKKPTVKDYYRLEDTNIKRVGNLDHLDTMRKIQELVIENSIEQSVNDRDLFFKPTLDMDRIIDNELEADKIYREWMLLFLRLGIINSDYLTLEENTSERQNMTPAQLKEKAEIEYIKQKIRKGKRREDPIEDLFTNCTYLTDNNKYAFEEEQYSQLQARRDFPIRHSMWTSELQSGSLLNIYKTGIIEGFKSRVQTLGKMDSSFTVPLELSRIDFVDALKKRFTGDGWWGMPLSHAYGVSVNKFTFEFFEFRPLSKKTMFVDLNDNCELYSIIDVANDNTKFPLPLSEGTLDCTVPKHDYHFLDNKDEDSIRKFMDFLYETPSFKIYSSDRSNLDVVPDKPLEPLELPVAKIIPEPVCKFKKPKSLPSYAGERFRAGGKLNTPDKRMPGLKFEMEKDVKKQEGRVEEFAWKKPRVRANRLVPPKRKKSSLEETLSRRPKKRTRKR